MDLGLFPHTGSCCASGGTTNSVILTAFSVCSEAGDNLLEHIYLHAQSLTDCVLTAVVEMLLLLGSLFLYLNCILINHLVQFKTRALLP